MKMTSWVVPLLMLLLIAGCGSNGAETAVAQMPEVNPRNCLPENIAKLPTKEQKERMSSLCLRQSNFKASEPREW